MKRRAGTAAFLAALLACAGGAERAEPAPEVLLLCGAEEVYAVDLARGGEKIWSWKAAGREELPHPDLFRSTDECKPVDGGRRVVITSSGRGGAAVVERDTGRVLFWARVVNAHSAELLPGNRLAAAASGGEGGDKLLLYDLSRSNEPLWEDELVSGHGVVWDARRDLLWALGGPYLRAYRRKDWDGPAPVLDRVATYPLPSPGGHDLIPVPGSGDLIVTTNTEVLLFDPDRREFRPHPVLGRAAKVKGVSIHPRTGRTAYVQAETSWWSERVRLLDPPGEIVRPGERLYKARWVVP